MQKRKQKILKYLNGLLSNGIGIFIALISQVLLARYMGAANFGLYTLSISLILLPVKLLGLGVLEVTHRFISISLGENLHSKIRSIILKGSFFVAGISLVLTLSLYFLSSFFEPWFGINQLSTATLYLSLFIPVINLQRWCFAILNGLGFNVLRIFIETTLFQCVSAAFCLYIWFASESVLNVILGYGLSYIATCVIAICACICTVKSQVKSTSFDPNFRLREMVFHGFPINIAMIGQRLFSRGDIIIIGILLDDISVGLYKSAYMLASGVKQFVSPINSIANFYMGKSFGKKNIKNTINIYNNSAVACLAFALPVYLALYIFAPEIISILYTSEYSSVIPTLKTLCVGFAVFSCTGAIASLFNIYGQNWARMRIVLYVALLNIVLNIILIKVFGLLGAAISTSLCLVLIYAVYVIHIKKIPSVSNIKMGYAPLQLLSLLFALTLSLEVLSIEDLYLKFALVFLGGVLIFITSASILWNNLTALSNTKFSVIERLKSLL